MGTGTEKDRKRDQEQLVDEALEETFPASDSTATGQPTSTEPAGRPKDRKPPLISEEEIEQAQRGDGHALNDSITRRR